MKNKNIFITQPLLSPLEEFIPYLEKIWKNKWLTNKGEFHNGLEKSLCDYLDVKYITLSTNGTLSLIIALKSLDITGEVITTPFTFCATTHALWWAGITPVFCDIEPNYFNLNPDKIESLITKKTTAILPVHVYGNPCDVNKIQKIADEYGLKVIYDAAHAFGVSINGNSILNFGDISILSFHATKVYNTFEGGASVSNNMDIKNKLDYLTNFGIIDETEVVDIGINTKMNEIQAAFGLLQLKYIDEAIEKRRVITNYYRNKLEDIDGIRFLKDIDGVKHNYSYFPILIDDKIYGKTRDDVYNLLRSKSIYARRYFYPLINNLSCYKNMKISGSDNIPVANEISNKILCLPIYPDLDIDVVDKIIKIIR